MILTCKNISKAYGTEEILRDTSFHINENEKAAIVGSNGAGKSTLLKIIVGELAPDSGEVITAKDTTIGYLSQHQELSSEGTIYEEMRKVKQDIYDLQEKIRETELKMKQAQDKELEQLLSSYTRLTHEFEVKNGYACESEITGVLKGLGFLEEDFGRTTSTLSGGQKTRVALGKLLLSTPDLILLDEPINHLDLGSIAWLEGFLSSYKGAVIIVAHDRYFLDRIVTKVIELAHQEAHMYLGTYTQFAEKKAMLREAQLKQYYNQQREIKHHEEVITKLRSFNREKSIKRAESREKLLNKIDLVEKPITQEAQMHFALEPSVTSGNDVLSVQDLSKSFGANQLFSDLSFDIKRGERVAIIGSNGTGKTTILKIINNLISADSGEIRLGAKVEIGYYDQEHHVLNMEKTLFDELQDTYPYMDNTRIRNILAAFLFTGDDVFKRIQDLSGGERGRVSLAKLMLSEANFLILDEPTNHLDIVSKEILENAICHYSGTVLYVSHDRYFINKTATRILDLTGGHLINYAGNYDYYAQKQKEGLLEAAAGIQPSKNTARPAASLGNCASIPLAPASWQASSGSSPADFEPSETKLDWQQQKEEKARLRKRQNSLKKCEEEIHILEIRSEEIDQLLTQEEIFTDVSRLMELNKEKTTIEQRLEELLEQWEALAEDGT